jgi:hypothetical protein
MTTLHEIRVWASVLIACVALGAALLPLAVYTTYRQREGQDESGDMALLASFCLLAVVLIAAMGLFAAGNVP